MNLISKSRLSEDDRFTAIETGLRFLALTDHGLTLLRNGYRSDSLPFTQYANYLHHQSYFDSWWKQLTGKRTRPTLKSIMRDPDVDPVAFVNLAFAHLSPVADLVERVHEECIESDLPKNGALTDGANLLLLAKAIFLEDDEQIHYIKEEIKSRVNVVTL